MNALDQFEKNELHNIFNIMIKDKDPEKEKKIIESMKEEFFNREKNVRIGDLVKVYVKIIEGKRERIQPYEGYVISFKGKGLSKTIKVRKNSFGVGVERTFPLYSPKIDKFEVIRKGKVRRAKLYYMRNRKGKSAMIREDIITK